jgi:hypothetical protein
VGTAGAAGTAGPGLVWRDAAGALVSPTTGLSNPSGIEVFFFDANGMAWPIDRETAQITATSFATTVGSTSIFYTGANCTGTAYTAAVTPGFVFLVAGDTTFYLRPFTLALETHTDIQSFAVGSTTATCSNRTFPAGLSLLPLATMTPAPALTTPATTFVGPLHLSPT